MAKTIITVDDSKTIREMVSFTLQSAGYSVIEAIDGKHALEVLSGQKVDLIITDINMPNMDGITLVKNLRANDNFKFTPILILTTEGDDARKQEGKNAGATGWVVKPFNPEKLLQVIEKVCA
ncbi:MAG: response regulator [Alphaproteobacteria bacterium]|jgi:two-component system chemotaxis response regulator CheY|nr:response regulator [Candidatus Jidaibacter sp.]